MAHPQYISQTPPSSQAPQGPYAMPHSANYIPTSVAQVSQPNSITNSGNPPQYLYTSVTGNVPNAQPPMTQPVMTQPGMAQPGMTQPGLGQPPGQPNPQHQLSGQVSSPPYSQPMPNLMMHTAHGYSMQPPGMYSNYYQQQMHNSIQAGMHPSVNGAIPVPPTPGAPNNSGLGPSAGPQFMNPPFPTNMSNIPNYITQPTSSTGIPGQQLPPNATIPGQPGVTSPQPVMGHQPSMGPMPSYNPAASLPTRSVAQPPEIKLEIIAKHLWDRDTVTKSDPTCVVFMEDRRGNVHNYTIGYDSGNVDNDDVPPGESNGGPPRSSIRWKEVDRTECLKNNLNPHFKVQITVPYVFEQLQHIKFGLWDIDSKKQTDLDSHDFLGEARTTVGELVMSGMWTSALGSPNAKEMKNMLGRKRNLGTITVIVHENRDAGNVLIKAHLSATRLARKDFGLSSDPYFIVTQVDGRAALSTTGTAKPAASRSQLYESEVIKRNVNPTWKPFHVRVAKPKGGSNSDMKLEFLVNDKDNHSRDDEIGKVILTVDELENTKEASLSTDRKPWDIFRKKPKVSGLLKFSNVRVIPMPSLVDYLKGGLKLHFSVAVDLTASNGNPNEPLSLHYCQDFYQGNQYTRALTAIANVLHVYAPPEQLFAAFGFGAVLPGSPGYTNSCFPLSLRPDPMCHGLQGILEAYVTALRTVKLSGPTNFAPLIDTVARTAAQRLNTQTDQNYDILLILTDGVVSDFELTVDQIISASHKAPLSIIIIGIGNRNFTRMRDLDSDGKLLTSADGNRQAARDICQFVAFNDHEGQSPERLGAAVLAEVPGNIVEYFAGICNPPINPGRRQEHHASIPFTQ